MGFNIREGECIPGFAMGMACKDCEHCQIAEWSALVDSELERLDRGRRLRSFLPGEPIYHEGDASSGVYCVSDGLIGIRKVNAEGESVLLRLVRPGETFGFRSFLTETAHQVSAEALKPTRLCLLPAKWLRPVAQANGALAQRFVGHMARDMVDLETKVLETATASCRVRFLRLLVEFGAGEGEADGTREIDLPLSRQDIAAMIGVRSETMSRVIRAIQDEGLAEFRGRRVAIPDPARLAAESLGDLEF